MASEMAINEMAARREEANRLAASAEEMSVKAETASWRLWLSIQRRNEVMKSESKRNGGSSLESENQRINEA